MVGRGPQEAAAETVLRIPTYRLMSSISEVPHLLLSEAGHHGWGAEIASQDPDTMTALSLNISFRGRGFTVALQANQIRQNALQLRSSHRTDHLHQLY